jgi:homeobox protein 2
MAEYGLYGAMVRHSLPLPECIVKSADKGQIDSAAPWLLSMHKKSIEAAHKLTEDDPDDEHLSDMEDLHVSEEKCKKPQSQSSPEHDPHNPQHNPVNKEELRSESIASLRAKAQSYTAKIREAIEGEVNVTGNSGSPSVNSHQNSHPNLHTPETLGGTHSSFDTPNKHSDSCDDSELLDPSN